MKAIIEFDLPEDQQVYEHSVKATSAFIALKDITTFLKHRYKHEEQSVKEYKELELIKDKVHEIIYDDNELIL